MHAILQVHLQRATNALENPLLELRGPTRNHMVNDSRPMLQTSDDNNYAWEARCSALSQADQLLADLPQALAQ